MRANARSFLLLLAGTVVAALSIPGPMAGPPPAASAAVAVVAAGAPTAVTQASAVAAASARKAAATISAVYVVRADGKVVVEVTTNAKKVQVKYRTAKGRTAVVTRKAIRGARVVVLPKGATKIRVRALSTTKLRRSAWVTAKPKPLAPPEVVTPPSAPPTPPPAPPTPPPTTPPPAQDPCIPAGTGITRVSTDLAGVQGNGVSINPVWSPDGTRVAFESDATDLVPGDNNDQRDVFIKNIATAAIDRVSVMTGWIDPAVPYDSGYPRWSPDGTKIAFYSGAALVNSDTNGVLDVYVRDLANGGVTRVSTGPLGQEGNGSSGAMSWSPDGTRIAFESTASNFGGWTKSTSAIFVKTLATGDLDLVAGRDGFYAQSPVWSPDAALPRIAFESNDPALGDGDANGTFDVYVKDLSNPGGTISRWYPRADNASMQPAWSPDGKHLAFMSLATDLVTGDTNAAADVFVTDILNQVKRVSVRPDGTQGDGASLNANWSADGLRIAFGTAASNLVAGDANGAQDVLVWTAATGELQRVSTDASGNESGSGRGSYLPSWCPVAGSSAITFWSEASNFVSGDTNGVADVFVRRLG